MAVSEEEEGGGALLPLYIVHLLQEPLRIEEGA